MEGFPVDMTEDDVSDEHSMGPGPVSSHGVEDKG